MDSKVTISEYRATRIIDSRTVRSKIKDFGSLLRNRTNGVVDKIGNQLDRLHPPEEIAGVVDFALVSGGEAATLAGILTGNPFLTLSSSILMGVGIADLAKEARRE